MAELGVAGATRGKSRRTTIADPASARPFDSSNASSRGQSIWTRQQEGVLDLKDVVHHTDRGHRFTGSTTAASTSTAATSARRTGDGLQRSTTETSRRLSPQIGKSPDSTGAVQGVSGVTRLSGESIHCQVLSPKIRESRRAHLRGGGQQWHTALTSRTPTRLSNGDPTRTSRSTRSWRRWGAATRTPTTSTNMGCVTRTRKAMVSFEANSPSTPISAPHLRQGLFGTAATYPVIARISSAFGAIRSDQIHFARGMAIKVLGVHGPKALPGDDDATQDFLLVNNPTIAFGDVRAYHDAMRLAAIQAKAPDVALKATGALARSVARILKHRPRCAADTHRVVSRTQQPHPR